MSNAELSPKTPSEVKDYVLDYSTLLGADTITASSFTVPAGLTQPTAASFASQTTKVWLGSGTVGTAYTITNVVTTTAGRTLERGFVVRVLTASALTALYQARLYLGDTVAGDRLFSDEEILAWMDIEASPRRVAYQLAQSKAAYYARQVDRAIDGLEIKASSLHRQFAQLADRLLREANRDALSGATIYVGGLSETERDIDRENEALVQPRFTRRQFENRFLVDVDDGEERWR